MYNKNSGYIGSKMSVRAVEAYNFGEKPKSKWNKSEILENLKMQGLNLAIIEEFKKIKVNILKDNLLCESSYHHTGKYYNKTYFFMVKEFFCDSELKEALQECLYKQEQTKKEKEEPKQYEYCYIRYNVWGYGRYGKKCIIDEEEMQGLILGDSTWVKNEKQKKDMWGNSIVKKYATNDYATFKKELKKYGIKAESKVYFNKLLKKLTK